MKLFPKHRLFVIWTIVLSKNGDVFPERENVGLRGTYNYASLNSHQGKDLSRRDDLISFMYSLIDMSEVLPWKGKDKPFEDVIKAKTLCLYEVPYPSDFFEIFWLYI